MQNSRINDWLRLIALVGVLVGLFFVTYEIRQNNELAQAESIRALFMGWQPILASQYETDIGNLYVKSLEEPENLTPTEIFKLSGWLSTVMNQYLLTFAMYDRGLGIDYDEELNGAESDLVSSFDYYFGNRFARAWYLENRVWFSQQVVEIMDREYGARQIETDENLVERIRSHRE